MQCVCVCVCVCMWLCVFMNVWVSAYAQACTVEYSWTSEVVSEQFPRQDGGTV